jgi:hypothetical protein
MKVILGMVVVVLMIGAQSVQASKGTSRDGSITSWDTIEILKVKISALLM